MSLPDAVRASVARQVGAIRSVTPVGGGCISEAYRLETADGPVFLKHHPEAPAGMFAAEADGLRALRAAAGDALRIPAVLAIGDAWIALEWLEPGPRGRGFGERLGRGLAALHRARSPGGWGWEAPNWIGSLPQENAPAASWSGFWRDRRLVPQFRQAADAGRDTGPRREWDRLFDRLPALLAEAEEDGPSLLHGDLWGGNVLSAAGDPALIDPAVYRGHREADLAMTELFGGFDAAFHAAYEEAWPLRPGYREARRGIYQLYYLLVHVTLFGGGYAGQALSTLRRVPGA
ncbi:fructosamine kinase family protein [Longimicrobium sp.]|uniref:fructosamine kinase family protein n=1 Tax=Longimicrobium sp. TaxID=2029185 RepID=UPI002C7A85A5|nr:fructosamine kinase family protein [Longimicrobium sp.]HSU15554.1 fructosamine kinase family protein [Longimicrobium sp.]